MKKEEDSEFQYYQNNLNVTHQVINGFELPSSERSHPVTKKEAPKTPAMQNDEIDRLLYGDF